MSEENKTTEETKKPKLQQVKKATKDNAEIGGTGVAVILAAVLTHYGFDLSNEELIILGGFLTAVGARIKDYLT